MIDTSFDVSRPLLAFANVQGNGIGMNEDGDLLDTGASGSIMFNVESNSTLPTVELELGPGARNRTGNDKGWIGYGNHGSDSEGWTTVNHLIQYREQFDPGQGVFGIGLVQRNTENDVTSDKAKGQFGGVIREYHQRKLHAFLTAGLAEIEGHQGVSLILPLWTPDGVEETR